MMMKYARGTIEGIGGRANENEVELISLRLISKEPEREIKRLFNAIRNKLKKRSNNRRWCSKWLIEVS